MRGEFRTHGQDLRELKSAKRDTEPRSADWASKRGYPVGPTQFPQNSDPFRSGSRGVVGYVMPSIRVEAIGLAFRLDDVDEFDNQMIVSELFAFMRQRIPTTNA